MQGGSQRVIRTGRKWHIIKNIIIIVALIIILNIIKIMFNEYSAILPLNIISGIFITEYIWFRMCSGKISICLNIQNKCIIREESAAIYAVVHKRSIYPYKKVEFNIVYKNKYEKNESKKKCVLELNDEKVFTFDKPVILSEFPCGVTEFIIKDAYVYDMLGIGCRRIQNLQEKIGIMVLPSPKPVSLDLPKTPYVTGDETEIFHEDRGRDISGNLEVREFRNGDSMNRIHWKLSSKTDELMVREAFAEIETNIYVFLDLSKRKNIDMEFEKSVSIAYELRNLGYAFYIMWFDCETGILRRYLVAEYEHINNAFMEIMKYDLYEKNEEISRILEQFMNEKHEVYNLFLLEK